ncbi:MAG: hypothetical protein BWX87_00216 [Bacteroidetes bacterium ADurb.Bin123]|nr:MAG: hypothetical protein BWX87_00216 [Bacteroidetes bacterium ADurb.Bin123]
MPKELKEASPMQKVTRNRRIVLFGIDLKKSVNQIKVALIVIRLTSPEINWQLVFGWKRLLVRNN